MTLLRDASLQGEVYPIQFAISEKKMIERIPEKKQWFASIIPGALSTYIYSNEADYYAGYRQSYFAHTSKKCGWDCMRHYEILANGCIPYFSDLDKAPPKTMFRLPRALILEAMNLPGVSSSGIDETLFDKKRYEEILVQLLDYTREHLTTRAMARYMLACVNYSGTGKILYLSNDRSNNVCNPCTNDVYPDYLRDGILIGLKELFGGNVVDVPKIPYIYTNFGGVQHLYGKGMSYTKIVEDLQVDREDIETRIRNREFDLVIYGAVHLGLRYHDLVRSVYSKDEILYLCGEDSHICEYKHLPHIFVREFEDSPRVCYR